uniref:Neurotransmitter-gated ion-channel ligand-binding domain-containing protein n=1 Tax=Romanomermis culicivorax TaxID=13658 RepID=A0A915L6J1_ROMCU
MQAEKSHEFQYLYFYHVTNYVSKIKMPAATKSQTLVKRLMLKLFSVFVNHPAAGYFDQNRLETQIFANYNRKLRPSRKASDLTIINIAIHIRHIEAVDDLQQTVSFHGVLFMSWTDPFLTWDSRAFNNTNSATIQGWKIWQPDIALYNSATGSEISFSYWKYPVWITSHGNVAQWQDFSFTVTCKFDYYYFPNDKQECTAVMGSWMYDSSEIDWQWIEPWMVRLAWYGDEKLHSNGWQLLNASGSKAFWGPSGLTPNPPPPEINPRLIWPMMLVKLRLQRHRPYFYATEVLPLALLSALTLASFWIETESLTLLILLVNLLAQSILSWGLLSQLPPSAGSMPRMIIIYGMSFGLTSAALFLNIVLNCFKTSRWNIVPSGVHSFISGRASTLKPLTVAGLSFYDMSPLEEDEESIITTDENMSVTAAAALITSVVQREVLTQILGYYRLVQRYPTSLAHCTLMQD